MRALLPLLAALTAVTARPAHCPCGYVVNSTTSEYYAIFTEMFETDFLHLYDLDDDTGNPWIPQEYDTTPEQAHGPYGKASRVKNVKANPLRNPWDWSGPGIRGQDPGLQLWTNDNLIDISGSNDSMIPMAEIVSTRDDMLYGSFRISMKTTGVNGTCGAFFFYLNDTQEIDMEFLSKANQGPSQAGFVHLVIQSDENQKKGYIETGDPDFDAHSLIFSPTTAYNEFRFDWLPDRVDFYANGELLRTITDNVPSSPGSLHIIHWSNGNDGWSGGPPEEDAVMTVSYVKAYFNSSNPVSTSKSLYNCHPSGRVGDVACRIPDQTVPPNPLGPNGNRTAQTYFFSRDIENLVTGLITPTATKTSHPTSGSERSFGDGSGSILCWMIGLGVGVFAFHGFDAFTALHAWMGIRAP